MWARGCTFPLLQNCSQSTLWGAPTHACHEVLEMAHLPVCSASQQLTELWWEEKGGSRMGTDSETRPSVRKGAARGGPAGWKWQPAQHAGQGGSGEPPGPIGAPLPPVGLIAGPSR